MGSGPTGTLTGQGTGPQAAESDNSAIKLDSIIKAEDQDCIAPIISHLKDLGRGVERNIWRMAFKYILIDDELYCWTAEDLLLKCLNLDQSRVGMGEVHEGIHGYLEEPIFIGLP